MKHTAQYFQKNSTSNLLIIAASTFIFIAVPITVYSVLNIEQSSRAPKAAVTWAFEETFDYGSPTSPSQSLLPKTFDWIATHRTHPSSPDGNEESTGNYTSVDGNAGFEAGFAADHDEDCTFDGSTKQHTATTNHRSNSVNPDKSFFLCNNHVMSSMGGVEGYSVSAFWPKQEFDFTGGGTLEFDSSFNNGPGGRIFWEVLIAPREETHFGAAPDWLPIDETYPKKHIVFQLQQRSSRSIFVGDVIPPPDDNLGGAGRPDWTTLYPTDPGLTDRRIRRLHRIELQNNQVTWSVQKQDGTFDTMIANVPGGLPFTRGLVLFKQHAYTPQKDGNYNLYTTHWDNIRFSGPKLTPYETYETNDVMGRIGNIGQNETQTINLPRVGTGLVVTAQVHDSIAGQVLLSINGSSNRVVRPREPYDSCFDGGWRTVIIPLTSADLRVGDNTFKWTVGPRPACATWYFNGFSVKGLEIQMDGTGGPNPPAPPPPPPGPGRVGDLNSDGKVNIIDASILFSKWGTNDTNADLNDDGTVNIFDSSILFNNWTG